MLKLNLILVLCLIFPPSLVQSMPGGTNGSGLEQSGIFTIRCGRNKIRDSRGICVDKVTISGNDKVTDYNKLFNEESSLQLELKANFVALP